MNKINFPAFKSVHFINNANEGPAKSHRGRGELVINKYHWDKIPDEHKLFILAHEEGHIVTGSRDEMKADAYASKKYLDAGGSLTQSVQALTGQLIENNPVHIKRAFEQYKRALKYDWEKNGNQQARQKLQTLKNNFSMQTNHVDSNGGGYIPFLGIAIGKKAKARKAAKQQVKIERKQARNNLINAKATSKIALANQGIDQTSGLGNILGSIANVASSITGGGGGIETAAPASAPVYNAPPVVEYPYQNTIGNAQQAVGTSPAPVYDAFPTDGNYSAGSYANDFAAPNADKNKNLPYIIGGVVLAVLVAIFSFKKK